MDITNLKAEYEENGKSINVSLQDICFKPLAPYNNECAVESVFQYFQNNLTFFNECYTSTGFVCGDPLAKKMHDPQYADFHDHFLYCVR